MLDGNADIRVANTRAPVLPINTAPQQYANVFESNRNNVEAETRSQHIVPPGIALAAQFFKLAEEDALRSALDDEYDSDEDLEEFKAKFMADRLAKREKGEAAAKNSKGFCFDRGTRNGE